MKGDIFGQVAVTFDAADNQIEACGWVAVPSRQIRLCDLFFDAIIRKHVAVVVQMRGGLDTANERRHSFIFRNENARQIVIVVVEELRKQTLDGVGKIVK